MSFAVVPLTRDEVSAGALQHLIQLTDLSMRSALDRQANGFQPRRVCVMTIYETNLLDGQTFQELQNRFAPDAFNILFLNECAVEACQRFSIPINPVAMIQDHELPAQKSLILNVPCYG